MTGMGAGKICEFIFLVIVDESYGKDVSNLAKTVNLGNRNAAEVTILKSANIPSA